MASTSLQFLSPPTQLTPHKQILIRPNHFIIKCTANPTAQNTTPPNQNTNPETESPQPDRFDIVERRRKSEIIRDRKAERAIKMPEPKNYEIGWKRTKVINLEKPKGYMIMDFLEKLEGLMGMQYGSTELLAKTGEIVAERAREEAEVLKEEGEVEERLITELFRVLKLMEMDLAMVKAAVKEDTLNERLEQAKARCRFSAVVLVVASGTGSDGGKSSCPVFMEHFKCSSCYYECRSCCRLLLLLRLPAMAVCVECRMCVDNNCL